MLSMLLGQSPSLFDDRKISIVDKGLTDIDHLPRHFHHVKVQKNDHWGGVVCHHAFSNSVW